MDLSSSVGTLLTAFSNAEDVDWLNGSGGEMGKSFAKWTLNDIGAPLLIIPRSLCANHCIWEQADL